MFLMADVQLVRNHVKSNIIHEVSSCIFDFTWYVPCNIECTQNGYWIVDTCTLCISYSPYRNIPHMHMGIPQKNFSCI